ncbi:hypothetical protein SRHO_G00171570 [Serrasalmus rhombeus]
MVYDLWGWDVSLLSLFPGSPVLVEPSPQFKRNSAQAGESIIKFISGLALMSASEDINPGSREHAIRRLSPVLFKSSGLWRSAARFCSGGRQGTTLGPAQDPRGSLRPKKIEGFPAAVPAARVKHRTWPLEDIAAAECNHGLQGPCSMGTAPP